MTNTTTGTSFQKEEWQPMSGALLVSCSHCCIILLTALIWTSAILTLLLPVSYVPSAMPNCRPVDSGSD